MKDLKVAGLNRVNISLDTLNEKKYAYITRGGKLCPLAKKIIFTKVIKEGKIKVGDNIMV